MRIKKKLLAFLSLILLIITLCFLPSCSSKNGRDATGLYVSLDKNGKSKIEFVCEKEDFASKTDFLSFVSDKIKAINDMSDTSVSKIITLKGVEEQKDFYVAELSTRKVDTIKGVGSIYVGAYDYILGSGASRSATRDIYKGDLAGQKNILYNNKSTIIKVSDTQSDLTPIVEQGAKNEKGNELTIEEALENEKYSKSNRVDILSFVMYNLGMVDKVFITVPGEIKTYAGAGTLISKDTVCFDTFSISCSLITEEGILSDVAISANVGFVVYEKSPSILPWVLGGIGLAVLIALGICCWKFKWIQKLRGSKKALKVVRNWKLYAMLIPGAVFTFIFSYIPMVGLYTAFTNYDPNLGIFGSEFVGFANFKELFVNPTYNFPRLLYNTLGISIFTFIFSFPAGVIFALSLNELHVKWFKKFAQTASYLPYFVSWIVVSGIVSQLLDTDSGAINKILGVFGVKPVNWYGERDVWWGIFVISSLWKGTGWGSIVFLAAIPMINSELYEACEIDGGGVIRKMFVVTLPGIFPTIALTFVVSIGGLIKDNFEQIYALLGDGNYHLNARTEVLGTLVYKTVMQGNSNNYSISTALGLFQGVISFLLVAGANWLVKKKEVMGLW